MDCIVHGVAKSRTRLSVFHFSHFWEDPLEEEMANLSSILVWRIPWGHKELDTTKQHSLSLLYTQTSHQSNTGTQSQ